MNECKSEKEDRNQADLAVLHDEVCLLKESLRTSQQQSKVCGFCQLLVDKLELTNRTRVLESSTCFECKLAATAHTNAKSPRVSPKLTISKNCSPISVEVSLPTSESFTVTNLRGKVEKLTKEKKALQLSYQMVMKAQSFAGNWGTDTLRAIYLELDSLAKSNSHLAAENQIVSEANKTLTEKLKTEKKQTSRELTPPPEPSPIVAPVATPKTCKYWYRSSALMPGLLDSADHKRVPGRALYRHPETKFEERDETYERNELSYGSHPIDLFW